MKTLIASLLWLLPGWVLAANVLPDISVTETPNAEGGAYTVTIIQPPLEDSAPWYLTGWGIINEQATDAYTGLSGWSGGLFGKDDWDGGIIFDTYVPDPDPPIFRFATGSDGIGDFDTVFGPGFSQAAVYWVAEYFGVPGLVATSSNFNWVDGAGNSTAFAVISNSATGENLACPVGVNGGAATGSCATVLAPVPLPAATWLFGSALLGLGWVKRRKVRASDT